VLAARYRLAAVPHPRVAGPVSFTPNMLAGGEEQVSSARVAELDQRDSGAAARSTTKEPLPDGRRFLDLSGVVADAESGFAANCGSA
jgi:hypothetical protein